MRKRVMVCVTQQRSCDRLIEYGHGLCSDKKDELSIIHVTNYEFKFLGNSQEGEALEYLYEKSFEYGANLTVVRSNHILETLVDLVRKNRTTHIVLGQSGSPEEDSNNMVQQLKKHIWDQTEIVVVPAL